MKLILAGILSLALMSAYCSSVSAQATEKPLKIGVLGDGSGPFADLGGVGTVYAAELSRCEISTARLLAERSK